MASMRQKHEYGAVDGATEQSKPRKLLRESWQPSHKYHTSMGSLLDFIQTTDFTTPRYQPKGAIPESPPASSSSASHKHASSGYRYTTDISELDSPPQSPTRPLASINLPSVLGREEVQLILSHVKPRYQKQSKSSPSLAKAMHSAIARKDDNAVFDLLRQRADPDILLDDSMITPLQRAIAAESVEIAVFLTLAGADLESTNESGETALTQAVRYGFPDDIIALICEIGAKVDAVDFTGRSALHYAAGSAARDDNTIMALVGHGASIDLRNNDGHTSLHVALLEGRIGTAQQLLEYGADADAPFQNGQSALHVAASNQDPQVVQLLCEYGACLDSKSKDDTPMTAAISAGFDDNVKILLEAGAAVNFRNPKGLSPLLISAAMGNRNLAELLISWGADLNTMSPTKYAPLHIAAQENLMDIVRLLVKAGAPIDPLNSDAATPLLLAVQEGHENVVRFLLSSGANGEHTQGGYSILWHAIDNDHADLARMLLEDGKANAVRVVDDDGSTSFHHAAGKGMDTLLDFVLQRGGTHVDTRDLMGRTPLFYAAAAGHISTLRLLQQKWFADVTARTSSDDSILSVCTAYPETLRFLLNLKASRVGSASPRTWSLGKSKPALDVNHRNEFGATALHYAALEGNLEGVKLLLQKGARQFGATEVYECLDDYRDRRNYRQGTPAGLARQMGFEEVAMSIEKLKHR